MTDGRWQAIEALFLSAADLESSARDAFLAQACLDRPDLRDEVETLLRAEPPAGDPLARAVSSVAQDFAAHAASSRVGERVGAYRLIDVIGHGGMGTVYLAERADDAYRALVAIKFVRGAHAAPELVRRFLAERQILADLNHPGIARLLDGGATVDGTPYLVLEYVEGVPIDVWCDTQSLGVRERIGLFLRVCEAVRHAHESKVVHRDLKPSNILVTADGAPKLVDFGIARILGDESGHETAATLRILTPAYASPEQVRGNAVTVATDVYSLGVVLYQLLAGRLPFDLAGASAAEIERRIGRDAAPPLSRAATGRNANWRRSVEGDLEAIVARTLRKRPDQRHASVAALAEDLRRFLSQPPGMGRLRALGHHARRMSRRRTFVLAAAASIGVMALVARDVAARRAAQIEFALLPVQVVGVPLPAPVRVVKADVNGDGRGDLVWNHLGAGENQVVVGLGQPDGTFARQAIVSPSATPAAPWDEFQLLVGDFNGDGRSDLLWNRARESQPNVVYVGFSNGSGSFRFSNAFIMGAPTLHWATGWQALVGDEDGDGSDDLLYTYLGQDNFVRAYRSMRDGTFSEAVVLTHVARRWEGYRAFVTDVDGDRRADLLWNDVPVWANRTYVARLSGDRVDLLAQQDHDVREGWSRFSTYVADINGDGKGDILWIRADTNPVQVYGALGQSNAQFQYLPLQYRQVAPGLDSLRPLLGDFNGDGSADIVWNSSGPGGARLWYGIRSLVVHQATPGDQVHILDVNGDGRDDVVWIGREGGRVYVALASPPGS